MQLGGNIHDNVYTSKSEALVFDDGTYNYTL